MKKIVATILFTLLIVVGLQAESLQAYLSYAIFNTPDKKPYIETYLVVNGKTLTHAPMEDGKFQGMLEVQILFKDGESIVNFDKYELLAPMVKDTSKAFPNLLDVQRYSLPQGTYTLELTLKDPNSNEEPVVSLDEFEISFPESKLHFSDIELLHSYSKAKGEGVMDKSGFNLTPFVFNFYADVVSELSFYAELYNSQQLLGGDQFLLYYYIRPMEVDKKLDQYFFMKKMESQPVNILLNTVDISQLPSGNYFLILEARNRNNVLLAKKETYFQRYNPNAEFNLTGMLVINPENSFAGEITSKDSLVQYIDYLYPISSDAQKSYAKSLMKEGDVLTLQRYFLNFWVERNEEDPQGAWMEYKTRVDQTNHDFRALRIKGYKTDRGRVYLQYGKPNAIARSYNEPGGYPYEIWHYYEMQGQRDKKFVFYTKDIATNDFQLIHSNAIGEINNYRWQTYIYSRTWDAFNIDAGIAPQSYGSFATDYYLQPR
jgi:GWxTD domain-containing protein